MCGGGGSPDTPEEPDPAAEPADVFLGEQDTAQEEETQRQGLRRFKMTRQTNNTEQTGLRIV